MVKHIYISITFGNKSLGNKNFYLMQYIHDRYLVQLLHKNLEKKCSLEVTYSKNQRLVCNCSLFVGQRIEFLYDFEGVLVLNVTLS